MRNGAFQPFSSKPSSSDQSMSIRHQPRPSGPIHLSRTAFTLFFCSLSFFSMSPPQPQIIILPADELTVRLVPGRPVRLLLRITIQFVSLVFEVYQEASCLGVLRVRLQIFLSLLNAKLQFYRGHSL